VILAVASGKGGTGKTTVAVSLARVAAGLPGPPVRLLDCDVEAPNAALFLNPSLDRRRETGLLVPRLDEERCTLCGRCVEVCVTSAWVLAGGRLHLAEDLCSGCGSCVHQCPEKALSDRLRRLGELRAGTAGELAFAEGRLEVGQGRATPIIHELKKWQAEGGERVILDAPPGSSCAVRETLRGADYALLVTEPSPFGLHDLEQVLEVARDLMAIPCGVIVNRSQGRDEAVEEFCRKRDLPVLARIPFRRELAEAYAEGRPLDESFPEIRETWRALLERLESEVSS